MQPCFVKLKNRGLIHIEGEDRYDFLQKLISNDIDLLKTQQSVYACLLTPQGKFLHEFFVIEGPGVLWLDCEGGARAIDLYKRLNLYRLRSKVQISVDEQNEVYAILSPSPLYPPSLIEGGGKESAPADSRGEGVPDPRHPKMGARSFEKPQTMEEKPFETWDEHRIRLCVPDGSRDIIPEQSTLIECGIDKLGGVSFEKGCYIGQELTARMHHRGLAKKHLYPVEGEKLPLPGTSLKTNEEYIGEMRSVCGTVGLALLKDEALTAINTDLFHVLNTKKS